MRMGFFGQDILKPLEEYVGKSDKRIRVCILLSMISTVSISLVPYFCGLFLQNIINTGGAHSLVDMYGAIDVATAIIFLIAVWYVTTAHSGKEMNKLSLETSKKIRSKLHEKMITMPIEDLEKIPSGDMTSRIAGDLPAVVDLISRDYLAFLSGILLTVLILAIMVLVSPILALTYLITLPATIMVSRRITKRSEKDYATQKAMIGRIDSEMSEIVSNHREIKTHNLEGIVAERFETSNRRFMEAMVRSETRSGFIQPLVTITSNLGYVMTSVLGAIMMLQGSLTLGAFLAFMVYVRLLGSPVTLATTALSSIRSEMTSLDRLVEVFRSPSAEDGSTPLHSAPEGRVEFEDVSFSYRDSDEILHGVSFEVNPGETVALTGPTGSGKSTIVNLMLRFYRPTSGTVRIDGEDVSDVPRKDLSKVIGAVMQEPWVFDGTIRENVVYNREWATDEDVEKAMEITGLSGFVKTLPQGLDTKVGNDIHVLPLAQKRMIAMTRAILGNPRILVLDEALEGLDPVTRLAVFDGLKKMMDDRTVIIVGHDRMLVDQADRKLTVCDGTVTES